LEQNYPNPFNPSTSIRYTLNQSGTVRLKIYNAVGQLVETVLDDEIQAPGNYKATVDIGRRPSGVYLYVLEQGTQRQAKLMMLLK
ncbi:MAG: T9SS type A sorting domain-containing protein, partial [Ignavibacteriales bacterium]|nr:T9SS type A sorting domain-containing protein [Ignavibacteriales bacterium]